MKEFGKVARRKSAPHLKRETTITEISDRQSQRNIQLYIDEDVNVLIVKLKAPYTAVAGNIQRLSISDASESLASI